MTPKVLKHFKKTDPKLFAFMETIKDVSSIKPNKDSDRFERLCRIIVGQQLSGSASRSIWKKFSALFSSNKPTARKIISCKDTLIREAGLSYAKIRALNDLSEKVLKKELVIARLDTLEDNEVREELSMVIGIGPWTAEMFLMFALGREDVFSYGDLGLMRGVSRLYGLKNKPTESQLNRYTKKWQPYRTYAALALWRLADIKK